MNKSLTQLAVAGIFTAAFILFDATGKLLLQADDTKPIKTDNNISVAESSTETNVGSEISTSETTVPVSSEITGSDSYGFSETSTELNAFTMTYSGEKEIGKYDSTFKPLKNSQLLELNREGIVVVGDSIASGFKAYRRLPAEQVLAAGSIGARNIHDFKVSLNGLEYDVTAAIRTVHPRYIYMSMGMNDLNIGTMEQYITNYSNLITEFHDASPSSKFIVSSITPISSTSTHSTNTKIDTYNQALYEMVASRNDVEIYYINTAQTIKDSYNNLASTYSGGDGLHLAPAAYDTILTYILSALSEIDSAYTIEIPEETSESSAVWTQPSSVTSQAVQTQNTTVPAVTTAPPQWTPSSSSKQNINNE